MIRKIRLTCGIICLTLITLLFLDFTGTLHGWFGWLAKIQFLPAILALNIGVVAFLIILTAVFGRIYCSVICPLGDSRMWQPGLGKDRKSCLTPILRHSLHYATGHWLYSSLP